MSATATTRELSKAIAAFIPAARLPLPDDLTQVIEAYLQKHAQYDQGASDRLQEELLSIYNKSIQDHPPQYAPFLAILRRLRPAIRSWDHVVAWWDKLVEPVLDHLGQEKGLADEALANVESILMFNSDNQEDQEEVQNPFALRLVGKWMETFQLAQVDGVASMAFKEKLLRDTLLLFGKKRPKSFFLALDDFFVKKEYRGRATHILVEFIQSQPPHLYQVLQTRLFDHIIRCLENDTSTTGVSLALTSLIMLLPNIPSAIVSYLPTLFNIYARLLFWDRERLAGTSGGEADAEAPNVSSGSAWEKCVYVPDVDDTPIPHLLGYFTILYGLYPINFMDYIRKPQRYLRHANVPNADDIEVQPSEIRYRSERYRQLHLLHPNFYSLTIDSEKTDFSRWIKSEPPDVVAECVALCLPTEPGQSSTSESEGLARKGRPLAADDAENDDADHALLSGSVTTNATSTHELRPLRNSGVESPASSRAQSALLRRSSQSSHPSTRDSVDTRALEVAPGSPTLHSNIAASPSQSDLQDMINSNKAIKFGLHQSLANDSVPSLALSHHESIAEKPSARLSALQSSISTPSPTPDSSEQVAELRRQILLLKNDLNFERYLKQQHMTHIGTLRRRQVKEAASEAEAQNLLMVTRNLKHRLEEAKRAEVQGKKESEMSRTRAKKWELDLSAKFRHLREEQKTWHSEEGSLKRELDAAKEECERLRKLVCAAEVMELNARQTMRSTEKAAEQMDSMSGELDRLRLSEHTNQRKERELGAAKQEAVDADSRAEGLRMQLTARDSDMQRIKEYYESQMAALNGRLGDALSNRQGRRGNVDTNSIVESVMAASRAKQLELQKQHSQLMRKYTVLQSSLLDMTVNATPGRSRIEPTASSLADAEVSAIVGNPLPTLRNTRSHRGGLFDHESSSVGGYSYQATPPTMETYGSATSTSTAIHRPSTPPGHMPTDGTINTSPQSERHYGRGGVQNSSRKERKDSKKKEEAEKKEKKGGIRGIRSFV